MHASKGQGTGRGTDLGVGNCVSPEEEISGVRLSLQILSGVNIQVCTSVRTTETSAT